jgi:hypothetical protein
MLWAAPVVALLSLPAAAVLGVGIDRDPQQIAYLFGLGLVGTWATLIPNKIFENRPVDTSTRRLVSMVGGLVVGALAILLGRSLQLGLPLEHDYFSNPQDLEPFYFCSMYGASAGWYGLAARDRGKRFRILPLAWTALLATMLVPLWPYSRWDGIAVATLIAATTQIVSPWSERSSRYAQYLRLAQKQNRKVKTA